MKALNTVAKAITAGVVAAYAIYQVATGAGSPGGELVVTQEWVQVGVTGLVAALAVWAVPNSQPPASS